MADTGARYKVYEPIDDKNLLTPCCGADTPTCTFSASVANDQALSVARAELAVEQCASPFRYHIDHGTSLAQFGSAWKSLAQGSAWPSVASTSKRLQTQGTGHSPTRWPLLVFHAVLTGTRTQRWCVYPSSRRRHTTTTAASAGTLSDFADIATASGKKVPTVPLSVGIMTDRPALF